MDGLPEFLRPAFRAGMIARREQRDGGIANPFDHEADARGMSPRGMAFMAGKLFAGAMNRAEEGGAAGKSSLERAAAPADHDPITGEVFE